MVFLHVMLFIAALVRECKYDCYTLHPDYCFSEPGRERLLGSLLNYVAYLSHVYILSE